METDTKPYIGTAALFRTASPYSALEALEKGMRTPISYIGQEVTRPKELSKTTKEIMAGLAEMRKTVADLNSLFPEVKCFR